MVDFEMAGQEGTRLGVLEGGATPHWASLALGKAA